MPVNDTIVDTVSISNVKNNAEFPSLYFQSTMEDARIISKQMNENLVRGSARLNGALDNLICKQVQSLAEIDPLEASSSVKALTGVDPQSQGHILANTLGQLNSVLPQTLAQLGGLVASLQQIMKGAQTTLPETGR